MIKEWPAKDVSKILRNGPAAEPWKDTLIVNDRRTPKSLLANAVVPLRQAKEWEGVLGYDEFSLKTVSLKTTPWGGSPGEWGDNEDRLATEWLQLQGIHISVETAAQAVQTVAQEHPFHPVRSYLNALKWDGKLRLNVWLRDFLGVEDSDYSRAVGRCFLVSAVARIFRPGVKADCCPIFEAKQGAGKSRAQKILGGKWFTDEIADLGSKDAAMQLQGAWIAELAELDSMSRAEVGRIKAFMSRTTDRFRPPYGKRVIESPRQCIFVGTVNHDAYLRDETGARRFWPIRCTNIQLHELEQNRDQLFAEAVGSYRAGDLWWLDSKALVDEATEEQSDRFEGDPWEETIKSFIALRADVSSDEILADCLNKDKALWSQVDKNRVARILVHLKWEKYRQPRIKDVTVRGRRYRPIEG